MQKRAILKMKLVNDSAELAAMAKSIRKFSIENELSSRNLNDITLAAEEIVSNIIFYAYRDPGEHSIEIDIVLQDKCAAISIIDDGKPFNPVKAADPDLKSNIDNRKIGGLGIFFAKKIASEITYRRANGKNVLQMTIALQRKHRPDS